MAYFAFLVEHESLPLSPKDSTRTVCLITRISISQYIICKELCLEIDGGKVFAEQSDTKKAIAKSHVKDRSSEENKESTRRSPVC